MFPSSQLARPSDFNDNYRLAVFYHDKHQQVTAEKVLAEVRNKVGSEITVELSPAENFYRAEDYHQQYYKKLYS